MGCAGSAAAGSDAEEAADCARSFHKEYVLLGRLGRGSFASVYETSQRGSNDLSLTRAVKVCDLRSRNCTARVALERKQRVEHEVSLLQKVARAPNCVKLVDHFVEAMHSYIVMEHCEQTLFEFLCEPDRLDENNLKPCVEDMARALDAIHSLGVVHRDVKPSNFLVTGGTVKLSDFGLAAALPGGPGGSLEGSCGSSPFMSPEMVQGLAYGTKTDIWSLGVILYLLLIGQYPYMPDDPGDEAMERAVAQGGPVRLAGAQISAHASQLLGGLLAREPSGRDTAKATLGCSWLAERNDDPPCLKAALQGAWLLGAFEEDRTDASTPKSSVLDSHLRLMQSRIEGTHSPAKLYCQPPPKGAGEIYRRSDSSTSAASTTVELITSESV